MTVALLAAGLSAAQAPHTPTAADRSAAIGGPQASEGTQGLGKLTIDELMKRFHVPGASIAVIHDFEIHWAKGDGVADVETGAPVNAETLRGQVGVC
jgi:CubicO group peptidase (beta-lactamase class C family)